MLKHDSDYTLGVDEVGRGCLFGNVVAAAVMMPLELPENGLWKDIKDSKKLTEKKRYILRDYIKENALCIGIGECTPQEIDNINILRASIKAMNIAINKAYEQNSNFTKIYIDGDRFDEFFMINDTIISHECITNGDNKYLNIAAASIIAKCYRDDQIKQGCILHPQWNNYDLAKNKGYGTAKHREAIMKYGFIDGHRKTFNVKNI